MAAKTTQPKQPTAKPGVRLKPRHVEALNAALSSAGLGGLKIASMHLTPAADGDGQPSTVCHMEQLPNGHWVIVCN